MYFVTFRASVDTDEATHNTIQAWNDNQEATSLENVVDMCATLGVDAELFDEAGFRKGWAKADGSYRLT